MMILGASNFWTGVRSGGIDFSNRFFGAGPDIICFLRQSQGIIHFRPAAKGVGLESNILTFFFKDVLIKLKQFGP